MPAVLTTADEARAWSRAHRAAGRRIGFVPTMGYLHAGHVALMHAARRSADVVIASVFVNPTQFGPGEDFTRYPRDPQGDLEKSFGAGCDAVFLPPTEVMYPPGHQTRVSVGALAEPLCGRHRPGHFDGVCTVVLKLFNLVACDVAVFGEKDYQQLAVVRRMVRDLDVPVEVVGHPIVREPDGLAMSSRNRYLDASAREAATSLSRGLAAASAAWAGGERDPRRLEALARGPIEATGRARIEYVEARDADDLTALDAPATRPVVLALAARFGDTRLIDNTKLG